MLRLMLTFLDVRDHQRVRQCSSTCRHLVATLDLAVLDLSQHAPISTTAWPHARGAVLQAYRSVQSLSLAGRRAVDDHDWLLLSSTFWAQLAHVNLDECLEITDFGLLSLLNARSQRLQSVSMRHCKRIVGDYASTQIVGSHPCLTTLDLDDTRVGFGFVADLDDLFPSLQCVHASHTPAHLEFFAQRHWDDLVQDLRFLVANDMHEPAHLRALLHEFEQRVRRWTQQNGNAMHVSAFERTLLATGARALVDVPLHRDEFVSALLYACDVEMPEMVETLVATGNASLDVTDIDSASPLCLAIHRDLPQVASFLLQAGADANKRTRNLATPLHMAAEADSPDMVALLLRYHANPMSSMVGGQSALCLAAKSGSQPKVVQLLAAEAMHPPSRETAAQHTHALFLACENGHAKIVQELLQCADVDANAVMDKTASPLYLACQMGHDAIVDLLLQHGANPNFRRNQGGISCLYIAAQEGQLHCVELLLHARANLHARMDDCSTALHIAARMGHVQVAKALLREGAQVNDQTRTGLTPLFIACEEGHLEMVELLLRYGAAVNLQAWNGTTPLFAASRNSHATIVRTLLLAGADVRLLDRNGTSPMDAATLFGNLEVAKVLLQFGARVGVLSLRFARQRRDLELQRLLMDCFYVQHFQTLQLLPPPTSASASPAPSLAEQST